MQKITPFLWFDTQAEEAANFYVSVFKNSKILNKSYFDEETSKVANMPFGTVLVVEFEIEGQKFCGLNGGPHFAFTPAISFLIECKTQEEVDYYWEKLSAVKEAEQCGWLCDKYGVSWQIVPAEVLEMMTCGDPDKQRRVNAVVMHMKKIDIAACRRAYEG